MALEFDIAVFALNEARTIETCVAAIDRACLGHDSRISVFLNGTTDRSIDILKNVKTVNASLQTYFCPIADKANAINQFLYSFREPKADVHFFIDGYIAVSLEALKALANALAAQQHAHIASGIPLSGGSRKDVARAGGSHVWGNLFAMRPAFANRCTAAQVRLPRGLYWGDGLIGAMAKHDLDPLSRRWDDSRVVAVMDATYSFRPLSPFRSQDIRRQYRRQTRQALGRIENEALKAIVYRDGFAGLPTNSKEMVVDWLQTHQPPFLPSVMKNLFMRRAIKNVRSSRDTDLVAAELLAFRELIP
jgi:hypothetical protein